MTYFSCLFIWINLCTSFYRLPKMTCKCLYLALLLQLTVSTKIGQLSAVLISFEGVFQNHRILRFIFLLKYLFLKIHLIFENIFQNANHYGVNSIPYFIIISFSFRSFSLPFIPVSPPPPPPPSPLISTALWERKKYLILHGVGPKLDLSPILLRASHSKGWWTALQGMLKCTG